MGEGLERLGRPGAETDLSEGPGQPSREPTYKKPGPAVRVAIQKLAHLPPRVWLIFLVFLYAGVAFYLAELRALDFQGTTWDLGIYQQGLWSAAQNGSFYEAPDLQTGGFHSFLEVHGIFLLYLVAPLYRLLPAATTLFAIQAAVVSAAAVPLYALARRVTHSAKLGLFAAVAFLAWTPTLSSTLYDFHAEAFLPISLFALAFLWATGHYHWAFVAAATAWSTFEIAPVLTFFLALFYLWPGALLPGATGVSSREDSSSEVEMLKGKRVRAFPTRFLRDRRYPLLLLAGSLAAYFALLAIRTRLLEPLLGLPPFPNFAAGYVIGSTPGELQLSLVNLSIGFPQKLGYWLLAYGLLGFVSLLWKRCLLLTLPWIGFTFLSSDTTYSVLGWQYGLVLAGPMLIGFAYGLTRAGSVAQWLRMAWRTPRPFQREGAPSRAKRPWSSVAGVTVFVGLLAINLALSPLNPGLQNAGNLGSGYHVTYHPPAGFASVQRVAALVPSHALVLASDDLFPFVTADPNAYSLSWTLKNGLWLPFGPSNLPPFAFLSTSRIDATPPWLLTAIGNPSDYGTLGVVAGTASGIVVLYEAGYSSPPVINVPAAT